MIPWTDEMVTELKPTEVFVFGSNEKGFHGAGTAGLAMRGDARNNWRTDDAFLRALTESMGPGGTRHLTVPVKGRWAVLGQARGLQAGRDGKSYAVVTVTRTGARRSVSRRDIYLQLVDLWESVRLNGPWTFLITPLGEGYAGYTRAEMDEVWEFLVAKHGLPPNVRFVGRPTTHTPVTST